MLDQHIIKETKVINLMDKIKNLTETTETL